MLRNKLVDEEEALRPSDWDKIALYISEALQQEAAQARSALISRLSAVESRITAAGGKSGETKGGAGEQVVSKGFAQLRGAVGGVRVKAEARLGVSPPPQYPLPFPVPPVVLCYLTW